MFVDAMRRRDYASDYGDIIHHLPQVVVQPRSADDVVQLIKLANTEMFRVGVRGAGNSFFGQAQIEGGVLLDMSGLNSVNMPDERSIEAGAGASWRSVATEAGQRGRALPVLADMQLSVGGTLSTGGIGPTSYNRGLIVDHVRELEVVTGAGERVICSDRQHSDLFEMVLGGMGQCAIIIKALLDVEAAPTRVLLTHTRYTDIHMASADLEILARAGQFQHLGVQGQETSSGKREYDLEAGLFIYGGATPEVNLLARLRGASHSPELLTWRGYCERRTAQANSGDFPKPSIYVAVPRSTYAKFIGFLNRPTEAAYVTPRVSVWFSSAFRRPLVAIPSEEMIYQVQIDRRLPGSADIDTALKLNRLLYEQASLYGGTRLTTSAIPFKPVDWSCNYGPVWDTFVGAKRKYDPKNLLGTSHNMFRTV